MKGWAQKPESTANTVLYVLFLICRCILILELMSLNELDLSKRKDNYVNYMVPAADVLLLFVLDKFPNESVPFLFKFFQVDLRYPIIDLIFDTFNLLRVKYKLVFLHIVKPTFQRWP